MTKRQARLYAIEYIIQSSNDCQKRLPRTDEHRKKALTAIEEILNGLRNRYWKLNKPNIQQTEKP